MRSSRKYAIFALFIIICCASWFAYGIYIFLEVPPSRHGEKVFFDVKSGATLTQISGELEKKGLITDAQKFMWLARYRDMGTKVQAGRFALNTGWKPDEILQALAKGKPVLERITIPEGLTWWQTGKLLEREGFARFSDFKNVVTDPEFLRHSGIPFQTAEGFLMPDTYMLKKPDSPMPATDTISTDPESQKIMGEWRAQARSVAARLIDNFWRKASPLWPGSTGQSNGEIRRPPQGDLKKWVTLASIVEKETGLDQERGTVAGVYANRIAKNMLLQADPTVIYGLGPDFSGPLKRSDLENDANPYNTYRKAGMPPGPISSFGIAALKAAISPEDHDYLYFVAKTDGGAHEFSRNLTEHNRAVDAYRKQKRVNGANQ